MSDNIDGLKKREVELYNLFEEVAKKFGQWNKGVKSDGAHYVDNSPFGKQGMVCSNCVFFLGGRKCEIVEGDISPSAICKLWVIRDGLLKEH
jgi:hypothetical protein